MILQKQKEAEIVVQGDVQGSIGMSLDLDSAQMLMQMLSKNLYSDDIGSTIRETASNALDSHRRAGVKIPIVVGFKESTSYNYEFTVEDFGTGLDDIDVENIISKYGKSTKREESNSLGMWGLGFKAPLAYSSSFYFICRKNGVERKYMMYEGEDANTIDLLYEQPTTERNGVKVIVPVKYSDRYTFVTKMKEQLAYFEDVYFENKDITNEFLIVRSDDFQFSELATDGNLHLCLDNVYYPIDFSKLGIPIINFPVALKFSLEDGIYPTPNREAIRYTQEAKKIILDKISKVGDFFVNKYNEEVSVGDDIISIINYLEGNGKYVNFSSVGKKYQIDSIIKYATKPTITPTLTGMKVLDFVDFYKRSKHYILNSFSPMYFLQSGSYRTYKSGYFSYYWNVKDIATGKTNVIVYNGKLSGNKKEYIRATRKNVFLVKSKEEPMKLGVPSKVDMNTYYHLLNLKHVPKAQWRDAIDDFNLIISTLTSNFESIEDIVVPQTFIDGLKKKSTKSKTSIKLGRASKLNGEISCKIAEPLLRYNDGRNCKYVSAIYKIENFEREKLYTVFGNHEDYLKLDALYGIVYELGIRILTFSEKDAKLIREQNFHNMIHIEDFMKGKNKLFKRLVSSRFIKQIIDKNINVFRKTREISHTSKDLANKLEYLQEYYNKWHKLGRNYLGGDYQSKALLTEMLEIAIQNNLFDGTIHAECLEIIRILDHLYFLNTICRQIGYYSKEDDLVYVMNDLFKYNKYKINLNHYNVKTIENEC